MHPADVRKPNSGMEYSATSQRNFSITRPIGGESVQQGQLMTAAGVLHVHGAHLHSENPSSFAVYSRSDGQRHAETGGRTQGATVQPRIHRLQGLQLFREPGSESRRPRDRSWRAWRGRR